MVHCAEMTNLTPKAAAFLHVIDDHRWLAASGCAWNLVGPGATNGVKAAAHELVPNIDVMILDSLLLHARSLIKFYRSDGLPNDILLSDFAAPIEPLLDARLRDTYQNAIEVHALHLTDWRDTAYRTSHSTGRGAARSRPDWNHDATVIVELLIFEALKGVSEQSGPAWQQPFKELYDACAMRFMDKAFVWPKDLSEKHDVEQRLKNLGLW